MYAVVSNIISCLLFVTNIISIEVDACRDKIDAVINCFGDDFVACIKDTLNIDVTNAPCGDLSSDDFAYCEDELTDVDDSPCRAEVEAASVCVDTSCPAAGGILVLQKK